MSGSNMRKALTVMQMIQFELRFSTFLIGKNGLEDTPKPFDRVQIKVFH